MGVGGAAFLVIKPVYTPSLGKNFVLIHFAYAPVCVLKYMRWCRYVQVLSLGSWGVGRERLLSHVWHRLQSRLHVEKYLCMFLRENLDVFPLLYEMLILLAFCSLALPKIKIKRKIRLVRYVCICVLVCVCVYKCVHKCINIYTYIRVYTMNSSGQLIMYLYVNSSVNDRVCGSGFA